MNAAKQKARELKNKERMEKWASGDTPSRPSKYIRQERTIADLRMQVMTLRSLIEQEKQYRRMNELQIQTLLSERAGTFNMLGVLASRLRDYGLMVTFVDAVVTVSEFNWPSYRSYVNGDALSPSQAVSESRQRQIVLDEDA